MNRTRIALLAAVCCLATSACWANDFMFSVAAAPVVALALLGWLTVGIVIRTKTQHLILAGPGALVAIVIAILLFFHLELIMTIWIIYLGLLVAYFAFGAKDIPAEARRANLQFHGIFLGVVIVGGIVAKIAYWCRQGGFAAWSEWMKEIYAAFLIPFVIITLIVFVFVRRAVLKRAREG